MHAVEELLGLEPLKVGDRVRVRLSGECPLSHLARPEPGIPWQVFGTCLVNGAEGTITDIEALDLWEYEEDPDDPAPIVHSAEERRVFLEHPYWVEGNAVDGNFARSELERVH